VPRTVRVIGFFFPHFISWWISAAITPRLANRKRLAEAINRALSV
jgi:hypothetical protein